MAVITKDLGMVTAYAYAVSQGYQGTEQEYAELMASYGTVAQTAVAAKEAAEAAQGKAEAAEDKAAEWATGSTSGTPSATNNAEYFAGQASGSATAAANKAGEAADSAGTASNKATAASGSADAAAADALKAEGYAVGKQGGTDVGSSSPYYHANAAYYAGQASGSATNAGEQATAASGSAGTAGNKALVAEGYANGTQNGTAVESGSPYYHNNAEYHAEQAAASAEAAAQSAASLTVDDELSDSSTNPVQNKVITGSLETKAEIDGYYEEMTVGDAEQLVATVGVDDSVPYNFRTAGGSADIGDRLVEKVVGGTVAWNQIIIDGKKLASNFIARNGTLTVGEYDATYTASSTGTGISIVTTKNLPKTANSKFIVNVDIYPTKSKDIRFWLVDYAGNTNILRSVIANKWNNVSGVLNVATANNLREIQLQLNCTEVGEEDKLKNMAVYNLTQMFGSTIADYIYGLEQANEGAGVAWFRKLFPKDYYAYDAGSLQSVQAKSHITRGFNAWDEQWEVGSINTSTGNNASATTRIRSKNYIPVLPNTGYTIFFKTWSPSATPTTQSHINCFYDSNKNFISGGWDNMGHITTPENARYMRFASPDAYGSVYGNDICISVTWDGERDGEYEAYNEHAYALDPDLELRGIPKLDSNNKLYYDGDEYESDGTVTRKYGIVDLGTLTDSGDTGWKYITNDGDPYFRVYLNGKKPGLNELCAAYITNATTGTGTLQNKCIGAGANDTRLYVRDSMYTSLESFLTAMSGVYLVYELATPITETADPFQNPQIVDDFGTEEYVDAGVTASTPTRDVAIPVGHNSTYRPNLRAKLEMAPDSPDSNGDYLVRHNNGENTYVPYTSPVPSLPAENGTYTLKCTVSGDSKTLAWVAEE